MNTTVELDMRTYRIQHLEATLRGVIGTITEYVMHCDCDMAVAGELARLLNHVEALVYDVIPRESGEN